MTIDYKEYEVILEGSVYLDKCPVCGFISNIGFESIEGYGRSTSNWVAQCPRCLSILKLK